MPWTYTWIALHISSAVFPAFLKVMARFLALFASSNVTLFDPFCVIFCLLEERSMAGPWAFVLNISSNSSTFKSWVGEEWNRQIRLSLKMKSGSHHLDSFLSIKEVTFSTKYWYLSWAMACSISLFVLVLCDLCHIYRQKCLKWTTVSNQLTQLPFNYCLVGMASTD